MIKMTIVCKKKNATGIISQSKKLCQIVILERQEEIKLNVMRYFEKAISSAITPQNETVIVDFVIRVTLNTELQKQVALILAFAF